MIGIGNKQASPPPAQAQPGTQGSAPVSTPSGAPAAPGTAEQQQKKKGFFGKILGVFKGDKDKDEDNSKQPKQPPPNEPRQP
jgi:hypothetical protein